MRASFGGEFSTEGITKVEPFHRQWAALIAGNDVEEADLVIERAKRLLRGKDGKLETVMDGFKTAYKQQVRTVIEDEHLSRFDMTMAEFKRKGKAELNPEVFASLSFQIKSFNLGCTFLVYGFDESKRAHLFTVTNPGKIISRDRLGYWAIGSGSIICSEYDSRIATGFRRHAFC